MAEESIIRSPDTERKVRVPPGQRVTEKWPVLHYGSVPRIEIAGWRFSISGLVKQERRLDYKEFTSLPRVKVFSDIHCVTGWSRLDNLWEGVSSSVLRGLVQIRAEARFVIVHAAAGFPHNL